MSTSTVEFDVVLHHPRFQNQIGMKYKVVPVSVATAPLQRKDDFLEFLPQVMKMARRHAAASFLLSEKPMLRHPGNADAVDWDAIDLAGADIEVLSVTLQREPKTIAEPVSKGEYREALRLLVAEARAGGHSGEALDAAAAKLELDGVDLDDADTLKI